MLFDECTWNDEEDNDGTKNDADSFEWVNHQFKKLRKDGRDGIRYSWVNFVLLKIRSADQISKYVRKYKILTLTKSKKTDFQRLSLADEFA